MGYEMVLVMVYIYAIYKLNAEGRSKCETKEEGKIENRGFIVKKMRIKKPIIVG